MEIFKNQQARNLFIVLLVLALVSYVNIREHSKAELAQICTDSYAQLRQTAFFSTPLSIEARGVYVYDFTRDREVYSEQGEIAMPLASLTKLMTARVALNAVSPTTLYTVHTSDIADDTTTGFVAGDTYTVHDILQAALIASSNTAARMLAHATGGSDSAFIAAMNLEASRLGLTSFRFESVTGLDDGAHASAYGSPKDIVKLLYLDQRDFAKEFSTSTKAAETIRATNGRAISLQNTDTVIPQLPLLVASKTGYTQDAGGNLAILWREPNGDLLGAALLGSSTAGRFSDMIQIHDRANIYALGARAIPKTCKQ